MPILFVHGVPATSRLWKPIMSHLDRDDEIVAVDLPGFASPAPQGWVSDKDNYVEWLIGEIEALHRRGGPVHLVGHDWGCLLTLRAASLRPDLLRSVAAGNGPIDPDWPLHALWNLWNIPDVGERLMDEGLTSARVEELLIGGGFPPEDAGRSAWATRESRRAILSLYRSASKIGTEWAEGLRRIVVPSIVIWGVRDLIVPVEIGRRMAARMGSEVVELDSDHFWPYARPAEAAAALTRLWARTDGKPTILTQDEQAFLNMIPQ